MEIIKKSVEINPNNPRSLWRARRLELYIAQRLEEYKKGLLGKKAESVRRVMEKDNYKSCLLYTSPSPRDRTRARMPSSA